jgi:hypothetical protein
MKQVAELIERAAHFQSRAEAETNPKLKQLLRVQAMTYLKLARKRAKELGLPSPSLPEKS